MRAVLQRVSTACVRVQGERVAAIAAGLLALIGVEAGDAEADALWLAAKIAALRIFPGAGGKMNEPLTAVGGAVLVVSQFTLLGDASRGHRPSFAHAERPEAARRLVERVIAQLRQLGCPVQAGIFGAHMQVELTNDGPVTICLDSRAPR